MNFKTLLSFFVLAFVVGSMAACDVNQGPVEKAGENIDNAIDDTGDAIEDAGDKVEEKMQ